MTTLSSQEIRTAFSDYFEQQGHTKVSSSALVPQNDPTLLFTNAGMVQFKDVFLGSDVRDYTRAVTIQRCVRAGGKHNDLENVGYTKRHHTFFEMLGNFSFGDYFKREAIRFSWDFLTKVLKIPVEKLWVTVFTKDKESEEIWLKEMKVDPKRFSRCGEKDNFWSMGDTGPCGPCTEIFYDHGPSVQGGPPGSPDESGDRYTEIWNLVFMQFNRDAKGKLTDLPKPCVDTGMGLERIAAVMQGVHDNYDIDIFKVLLSALSRLLKSEDTKAVSMRVIVDHIRSACFLIADGVTPSNEGRGYVVRRIIRRAARYGFKLGCHKPFFHKLVAPLVLAMGEAYPHLQSAKPLIEQVIEQEEKQFSITLAKGLKILDKELDETGVDKISGQLMFQLYDTYGFPPDLTIDVAKERRLSLDMDGFHAAMTKQRAQSQQTSAFGQDYTEHVHLSSETVFTGYEKMVDEGKVMTLLHELKPVAVLRADQVGMVVLDQTPFYAESGGQVGDTGYLYFDNGRFRVQDTQRQDNAVLHYGQVVSGELKTGMKVRAEVDTTRQKTRCNHSATHLLHEALRRVLGEHVIQKGSLVEPKRLRFDFSHPSAVTPEQILAIEKLVNQQIRANAELHTKVSSLTEAKRAGAMALFSEKYADDVRVVRMGDFSFEICGGTHVTRTGDIGLFKIVSESACAAGVRRIEALTGDEALHYVNQLERQWRTLSDILKTPQDTVLEKLTQLIEKNKQLNKEVSGFKQKMAHQHIDTFAEKAKKVGEVFVLIETVPHADRESLRHMIDQLKTHWEKAVILLATIQENKIMFVAYVSKPLISLPLTAADVIKAAGGKGGGRPDMAQGGGEDPTHLAEALRHAMRFVEGQV